MAPRALAILFTLAALAAPARADEVTRIRVHLIHALDHVLAADTSALTPSQRAHRTAAIGALGKYIVRGEFPRRTGDPFVGLRPRFVDDRGVNCAVGQLIVDSGAPELTRSIAAAHEYDLVRDIHEPALLAWATTNGFTVDELAMIQPGYSAVPTAGGTRRRIEDAVEGLTIICAAQGSPPKDLQLRVHGDTGGHAQVTATGDSAFHRCFTREASKLETGGRAYMGSPKEYDFAMAVKVPAIQQLFERAFEEVRSYTNCMPRPGTIPRRAAYKVGSTNEGMTVAIATSPSNTEIDRCLEAEVRQRLGGFAKGAWMLAIERTHPVTSYAVRNFTPQNLHNYASGAITACYPAKGAPKTVTVAVTAKPDDAAFSITVDAKERAFKACIVDKLQTELREAFSVSRADSEPYFRIDTALRVTATVTPVSPAAVKKQNEEHERERERHKYDM
jgi:hypothetical protein